MKTRLLVSFDQIRVSQPVNGENGRLLGFTREYPDRMGQFCMELTREQWTELQRFRWASPIIENGFLIPDVDFVAKDGKVFLDAAACVAHERALDVPAWLRAILDKRSGVPADLCGNHERAGFLHVDMVEIGSEETLLGIINAFEHLIAYELGDFDTRLVLFGTHPAFEFIQVPDVEVVDFYALPKYEVRDGQIKSQCGQVVKSSGSYPENECANHSTATNSQVGETVNASGFEPDITGSTPVPAATSIVEMALAEIQPGEKLVLKHLNPDGIEKALALAKERGLKATLEGDDVVVTDMRPKPNPDLEAKLLTALANGKQKAAPLAESLGCTVDNIRAAVRASQFLVWSGPYLTIKAQTVQ